MEDKRTTDLLVERYATSTRLSTIEDENTRRVVFKSFRRLVGPWLPTSKTAPILDIGCGPGTLLAFLRAAGYSDLHGFDLSPENVSICHRLRLGFVEKHDALDIQSFEPGQDYETIFLLDVLEHLPKESAAGFLRQVRGRLRPRASLVVQTPNMGSVLGTYYRYSDLSHEWSPTERSARDLLRLAGFRDDHVQIRPAWNATTMAGRAREVYLRILHLIVFLSDGSARPRIPSRNLLIRAVRGLDEAL